MPSEVLDAMSEEAQVHDAVAAGESELAHLREQVESERVAIARME